MCPSSDKFGLMSSFRALSTFPILVDGISTVGLSKTRLPVSLTAVNATSTAHS